MTIKDRIKAIVGREFGGTVGIGAQALLEIVGLVPMPAQVVASLDNFASAFAEHESYDDREAEIIGVLEWLECYGNGNTPGNYEVNTIAARALRVIQLGADDENPMPASTTKPPLGLVPLDLFNGTRLERRIAILQAMLRYSQVDKPIPNAWITELATHLNPVHVKLSKMEISSGEWWWVSLVRAVDLGADSFSANSYTVYTSEKYEQAAHEAKDYAEFFGTKVIIACTAPTMTLEQAIAHAEEKGGSQTGCEMQHTQLAEWLKELKELRQATLVGE